MYRLVSGCAGLGGRRYPPVGNVEFNGGWGYLLHVPLTDSFGDFCRGSFSGVPRPQIPRRPLEIFTAPEIPCYTTRSLQLTSLHMKLSYTELMALSAILRSPTRTLVLTRDSSTYIDQRRLLDALNRKDIFLLMIEDVKRGAALRGLEVPSVIYDETISAMSFTDEERAMIHSRVRTPVTGIPGANHE